MHVKDMNLLLSSIWVINQNSNVRKLPYLISSYQSVTNDPLTQCECAEKGYRKTRGRAWQVSWQQLWGRSPAEIQPASYQAPG